MDSEARPPEPSPPAAQRLDHLLQAAAHLEAAGLVEQAAEVRRLAAAEKETVLRRIASLEAELAALRAVAGQETQILLRVKVVELSRSKLRELGFDFSVLAGGEKTTVANGAPGGATFSLAVSDRRVLEVIESLRRDNLVRVLAEPTMVTLSGRPAHFRTGGEFPIPPAEGERPAAIEFRQYGTSVDVVPELRGPGRVRLELRVGVSELDQANRVEVGGQSVPGLRVRQVDTAIEAAIGQTVVIGGLVQERAAATPPATLYSPGVPETAPDSGAKRESIETLILVTPELVDRSTTVPQPLPPAQLR